MKKIASIAAILLLLFNGTGALYGGWLLMLDPSGAKLKLAPTVLANTPFPDFLLPGVILFAVNGILSLVVTTALLTRMQLAPHLVALQGSLLTGWILIQYFWTQVYHPLQVVMGGVGLLLVGCGVVLYRVQQQECLALEKKLNTQPFLFN